MAIDPQKRQKYLFIVLACLIIAGAIIFWINRKPVPNTGTFEGANSNYGGIEEKIDLSILESEEFISLKKWGEISRETIDSESGRENPFIPPFKE